jgi:hypothetical protein
MCVGFTSLDRGAFDFITSTLRETVFVATVSRISARARGDKTSRRFDFASIALQSPTV